jgi:hypothetical protein
MFDEINKRVKNLDALDIGLIKWSVLFFALIVIKMFPQLLHIGYLILIIIVIALAARPVYRFWKQ